VELVATTRGVDYLEQWVVARSTLYFSHRGEKNPARIQYPTPREKKEFLAGERIFLDLFVPPLWYKISLLPRRNISL